MTMTMFCNIYCDKTSICVGLPGISLLQQFVSDVSIKIARYFDRVCFSSNLGHRPTSRRKERCLIVRRTNGESQWHTHR